MHGRRPRHPAHPPARGRPTRSAPDYVHRVTNEGPDPAVSLHVYAPRLEVQHDYVSDDGILRRVATRREGDGLVSPRSRIDLLLSAARARLRPAHARRGAARGRGRRGRRRHPARRAARRARRPAGRPRRRAQRARVAVRPDERGGAAHRRRRPAGRRALPGGLHLEPGGRRAAGRRGARARPTSSAGMPRGSPPGPGRPVGRPSRAGRPGARFGSAPRDPDPRRVALADDHLGDAVAVAVEGVEVGSHRELARRGSRRPRAHGGRSPRGRRTRRRPPRARCGRRRRSRRRAGPAAPRAPGRGPHPRPRARGSRRCRARRTRRRAASRSCASRPAPRRRRSRRTYSPVDEARARPR